MTSLVTSRRHTHYANVMREEVRGGGVEGWERGRGGRGGGVMIEYSLVGSVGRMSLW